jgi:hypothetical protein
VAAAARSYAMDHGDEPPRRPPRPLPPDPLLTNSSLPAECRRAVCRRAVLDGEAPGTCTMAVPPVVRSLLSPWTDEDGDEHRLDETLRQFAVAPWSQALEPFFVQSEKRRRQSRRGSIALVMAGAVRTRSPSPLLAQPAPSTTRGGVRVGAGAYHASASAHGRVRSDRHIAATPECKRGPPVTSRHARNAAASAVRACVRLPEC